MIYGLPVLLLDAGQQPVSPTSTSCSAAPFCPPSELFLLSLLSSAIRRHCKKMGQLSGQHMLIAAPEGRRSGQQEKVKDFLFRTPAVFVIRMATKHRPTDTGNKKLPLKTVVDAPAPLN